MSAESSEPWPARPGAWPRQVAVTSTVRENYRTRTLVLDWHIDAQPGQFVMVWLPGLDEKPFSLAGACPVTLTVCNVGPFSDAVHALRSGDRLGVRGPFGHGFVPQGRRALLAGGGYGVAPLAFLAEMLLHEGIEVTAVIGARTAADLLLIDRFEALGVIPQVTTDDGSAGTPGRITAILEPLLEQGAMDTLYACGPHAMLAALERASLRYGVPTQLSWEAYMRCGMGICGSCEHDGLLVCRDGPVLAAGVRPEAQRTW